MTKYNSLSEGILSMMFYITAHSKHIDCQDRISAWLCQMEQEHGDDVEGDKILPIMRDFQRNVLKPDESKLLDRFCEFSSDIHAKLNDVYFNEERVVYCLVCGIKLPSLKIDPNQIHHVRYDEDGKPVSKDGMCGTCQRENSDEPQT